MEEYDKDPYQGGYEAADVWIFLQICHSFGVSLSCRDVGGYLLYRTGPRGVQGPGSAATDRAYPLEAGRQEVGLHIS